MAFTRKAASRKSVQGWEMRRTHSPDGATTAEFFVGVIFRVSIRKKQV